MYKSRNKKSSYRFSLLHPFVDLRHHCLVTSTIEHREYIIKCKCHHRLELNSATKQTKERKENIFGFFKGLNERKRKEKYFCCFCKINEQRRTGKNFENIKANKMKTDNTMER